MRESERRVRIREKIYSRVRLEDGPLETPCHVWGGPTSGTGRGGGYPRMQLDGGTIAVHKASWINENGIVPPKKQLDHLCKRRMCVNEEHLELVTHKQNQRRRRK